MRKPILFVAFLSLGTCIYAQSNLARWNFNSVTNDGAVSTGNDAPVVGNALITPIGGVTNSFNTGYALQVAPIDSASSDNSAYSITGFPLSGSNPKSAGIQIDLSTVSYSRINLEFWQRLSNTSANTWVLQYTLDKTGNSTSGTVQWTDAQTFTVTPQVTGTGDTWHYRSYNFSGITGLNNNINAAFRIVSAYDPIAGDYVATKLGSTYAGGTTRFDLVRFFESPVDISIAAASNFTAVNEEIGTINIPVTIANANNATVQIDYELSSYTNASQGIDFTLTGVLSVPAGINGIQQIPLAIIDDQLPEEAERIIVKLKNTANALVSATNNYEIIFIRDNDNTSVSSTNELKLDLLTSFSNGTAGSNSAEIVSYDPAVKQLYIANSIGAKLDIVDFTNPTQPVIKSSISVSPYGNINSVVAHDSIIAMAIENASPQSNGFVVFLDYNGNFIKQVEVGAMPDMITFNKDFTKVLTANEGEPNSTYTIDPEGSVSIIDLSHGVQNLNQTNVTTLSLSRYNGQESLLRSQSIRIFSTSASVAQDLEPEYIAISEDNKTAFVTLQENNALLTIDLTEDTILSLRGLGTISYDLNSGNFLDASDQSGSILLTGSLPIKGIHMPDAIAYKKINGTEYIFTANEGDSREFGSVIDANRISSSTFNNLDPIAFPDPSILRNNKFLGRLNALKYSGDTDGDGDYDELHVMGGRSFSVFDAVTGTMVYDSKGLFEKILANDPVFKTIFNASNSTGVPSLKNRSDDKGPEPEGIAIQEISGIPYLFVALERIGGAMVFNIENPLAPIYVGYYNNRSTTTSGPDLGAEGIITIPAADSPIGEELLVLANEVSSTLSIYKVKTCNSLSVSALQASDLSFCDGDSVLISVQVNPNTSIQWFKDGAIIPQAINDSIFVSNPGSYSLFYNNTAVSCQGVSDSVFITLNPQPAVDGGADVRICSGNEINLTATGAATYSWNNGVVAGQAFTPTQSGSYIVTGTDANGCVDTDTVDVTVDALPVVNAGIDLRICSGNEINLTATGAATFTWNNGVIAGQAFTPTQSGSYIVTGTDANGCVDTDTVDVTVDALPIVSAGPDISNCDGTQVTLTATGALTYTWNNGVMNGAAFVPQQSGTYIVLGTDINGCIDSDTLQMTIKQLPLVDLGIDITLCTNQFPYNLQVTTNGQVQSWSTGETGTSIMIYTGNNYSVTAELNGCIASDVIQVTEQSCAGIDDIEKTYVIYPNPVSEKFVLLGITEATTYSLISSEGKEVHSGILYTNSINEVDCQELKPGVYYLVLSGDTSEKIRVIKL